MGPTWGAVSRNIGVCLVVDLRGPSIYWDCWGFESPDVFLAAVLRGSSICWNFEGLGNSLPLELLPLASRQTTTFAVVEDHPNGMDSATHLARLSVPLASWLMHDCGVFHATHKVRRSSNTLSANWPSQLVMHSTAMGGTAGGSISV